MKIKIFAFSLLSFVSFSNAAPLTLAQSPSLRSVTLEVRNISATSGCDIEGLIFPPELYAEVLTQVPLTASRLEQKTVKTPRTVRGKGDLNFKLTRSFLANQVPPEIRFQITLRDKDPLGGDQTVDVNHQASHGKAIITYDLLRKRVFVGSNGGGITSQPSTNFNFSGKSTSKCRGTLNVRLYEPGSITGPGSPSDIIERER